MISRFEARARSQAVARRNTSTAMEMAETAEGGAAEIVDTLQRLREIAVEAADGTLTSTDRAGLNTEYQDLLDEVDRLAESTTFNGKDLLSGATTTFDFQVGIDGSASDVISVAFGGISAANLGISASLVSGTNATNANAALTAIDTALGTMGGARGRFGAAISRFGTAISNSDNMKTRLEDSVSVLRDADIVEESTLVARYQVLLNAGASALASASGMNSSMVEILLGIK